MSATIRKVSKNSGFAIGQVPGSIKPIPIDELPEEYRAGVSAWLEDRVVRVVQQAGYCSETTNVLSRVVAPVYGGSYVNSEGVDCWGNKWRDADGYDAQGFNEYGYNREGFNAEGFDKEGFNAEGFDAAGVHRDSPERFRFSSNGRDRDGYDRNGLDRHGRTREENRFRDILVFDVQGYDPDGFNQYGENRAREYSPAHDRSRRSYNAEALVTRWVSEGKLPADVVPPAANPAPASDAPATA